jgi:hypothetical protein
MGAAGSPGSPRRRPPFSGTRPNRRRIQVEKTAPRRSFGRLIGNGVNMKMVSLADLRGRVTDPPLSKAPTLGAMAAGRPCSSTIFMFFVVRRRPGMAVNIHL